MKARISIIMLAILSMLGVTAMPQAAYASNDLASFANLSVEASPHTGSATFAFPIEVPAGRGGIQPNIQLSYNSSSPNGFVGVGWNLELGSIQRSTKKGVPSYTDEDTFILIQSGNVQELVFDDAVGYYRSKIENHFSRIEWSTSGWKVTDKNGAMYFFGQSNETREYDPDNQTRVFKWVLDRVEDVHGNSMTFRYLRDGNILLPQRVDYTGNSRLGIAPHAYVIFDQEQRTDTHAHTDYRRGYPVQMKWRLRSIGAHAGGELQRRYMMNYVVSPSTERLLLKNITLFGRDGVSTLPAMTFDYQESDSDFQTLEVSVDEIESDNLWNIRQAGGFDRGHDNFVTCGFNVGMGQTMTQASGRGSCGPFSINTSTAQFDIHGGQDCANEAWTYVFVSEAKTVDVNLQHNPGGLCVAVNGKRSTANNGKTLSFKEGWNSIQYFFHAQHHGARLAMTTNLASQVDAVNSKPKIFSTITGDFNGDGFADLARAINGGVQVSLSDEGVLLPEALWVEDSEVESDHIVWRALDFNADGKTDMVRWNKDNGDWWVSLSTGSSFQPFGDEDDRILTRHARSGENTGFGDMNADGFPDLLTFDTDGKTHFLVNEEGRGYQNRISVNKIEFFRSDEEKMVSDINGDGLADFVGHHRASGRVRIGLNHGKLFDGVKSVGAFEDSISRDKNLILSDFNQDGRIDIAYYDYNRGRIVAKFFKGSGFGSEVELPLTFGIRTVNTQITAADFNGDVLPDIVATDEVGNAEIAMSTGRMPDVLARVDNGVGGFTSIKYIPVNKTLQNEMPFPMQVVQHVTRSSSLGDSYRTYSEYRNGLWDAEEREFLGFGTVRMQDAEGTIVETIYHQDDDFKGRIKQQDTYDNSENLYAREEFTYELEAITPDSDFIYLKRKDSYVFDGDTTGRRIAEEYFYEEPIQRGNLTKTVSLGEVDLHTGADIGVDSRTIISNYTHNTSAHIVSLPKEIVTRDHNQQDVDRVWFNYDGRPNGDAPTKGLLTLKKQWSPDSEHGDVFTRYRYDDVGNLTTTINARNHETTIQYDPQYKIFPLRTTNAINHSVINEYYGVNGVPFDAGDGYSGLWGQLKRTTDPNSKEGAKGYDLFGRTVFTVGPNDSVNLPSSTMDYQLSETYSCLETSQRIESGKEGMLSTLTCHDGLGREVFTRVNSESPGTYVVTGLTQYNARGLPEKEYLPRFTTNPFEPINPSWPHTTTEYDAIGRVVKTINPDQTYSNVTYDDWTTTSFSPSGHKQETDIDAYGQLVEKREYTGSDGRDSQYYPSEAYQLYARTQFQYDSKGGLLKTIDAKNNVVEMRYDTLGRKVWMNDPDMGVWQYVYDASNNLVQQMDAKLQSIHFEYDALNRLTRKWDNKDLDVDYTYDDPFVVESKGRITRASYNDDSEHARFGYDELGREVQSVKLFNETQYQVDRRYDALNRLMNVAYPDQAEVHYRYNRAGQIEAVANMAEAFPVSVPPVVTNPDPGNGNPGDGGNPGNGGSNPPPVDTDLKLFLAPASTDSVLFDKTGRHSQGTISQAVLQNGQTPFGEGKYVRLNTVDQDITIPDHDDWDILKDTSSDWTVDLWVRHEDNSATRAYLSHYENHNNNWEFGYEPAEGLYFKIGANYKIAGGSMVPDQWHHIALVKQANQVGLYLNGNQVAYGTMDSGHNVEGSLFVGSRAGIDLPVRGDLYGLRIREGNSFNASPTEQWLNKDAVNHARQDYASVWVDHRSAISEFDTFSGGVNGIRDGIKDDDHTFYFANFAPGSVSSYLYIGFDKPVNISTMELTYRAVGIGSPSASIAIDVKQDGVFTEMYAFDVSADYITTAHKDTRTFENNHLNVTEVRIRSTAASNFGPFIGLRFEEFSILGVDGAYPLFEDSFSVPSREQYASVKDTTNSFMQYAEMFFDAVLGVKEAKAFSLIELLLQRNIMHSLSERLPSLTGHLPSLRLNQNTVAFEGREVVIEMEAQDADGDTLTFVRPQQQDLPSGAVFHVTRDEEGLLKGRIQWNSQQGDIGQYTIPVEVSDGKNTVSENTVLNIQPGVGEPSAEVYVKNVDYTASGQIDLIEFGNGITTDYEYDPYTLRLKRKYTFNEFGTVLQHFLYSYDATGNIVNISDLIHTATQSFQYDAMMRLVRADGRSYGVKTYRYDEIGNIIEKDNKTYFYGANGAGPHAVTSLSDGTRFEYDANGNMRLKVEPNGVTTKYVYDVENRLLEVQEGNLKTTLFTYDGDGGRTSKTANGRLTRFIGSLYEESTTGATKHIFLGDMRIASITNGDISYHLTDHLGGANIIANGSGTVRELVEYEPFGKFAVKEKFGSGEEVAWHYFTGQHYDPETELYFYNARYYDPELGRFITPDTVVPYAEDSQSYNRYTYVRNNPVNLVDPSGHIFGIIFAAISFIASKVTIGSIIMGAIIGGALGGITAAITGGDIGQGIISGAIGGAIFGGIGDLGLTGPAQTLAHAAGGAASGAINAARVGGDAVKAALLGGLSAGAANAFAGVNPFSGAESELIQLSGEFATRSIIGGTIGGVTSELGGGAFADGFEAGFYSAAVAYVANHLQHRNRSDTKKAQIDARRKAYNKELNKAFWEELYNNPPAVGVSITVGGMKTSVTTAGTYLGASSTAGGISFDIYSKAPGLGPSVGVGPEHLGLDLATDMTVTVNIGISEDFFRGAWVSGNYNYMHENNGNVQWAH